MRKVILSFISSTIVIFIGLSLFQNCGDFKTVDRGISSLDSETPSAPEDIRSSSAVSATAINLFRRLAGVTPDANDPLLAQMEELLLAGDARSAATIPAMTPEFINVTVRDFATKMSNAQGAPNTPLNDFVATVMGTVRDNTPATAMLTENYYYQSPGVTGVPSDLKNDFIISNNHYRKLDELGIDLNETLQRKDGQQIIGPSGNIQDLQDPAGLMTTRGWMAANAEAGTNRALITSAFTAFLCSPLENWADSSIPDDHVGREIGRLPSKEYHNKCKTCHAPMDALRPATAYFDFSDGFTKHHYTYDLDPNPDNFTSFDIPVPADEQLVPYKFRRGANIFPQGHRVTNSDWDNFTKSSSFGWRSSTSGSGMSSFAEMVALSEQFSRCMVQRVFKIVCRRDHLDSETGLIQKLATDFENENYEFRSLFINVAIQPQCVGVKP